MIYTDHISFQVSYFISSCTKRLLLLLAFLHCQPDRIIYQPYAGLRSNVTSHYSHVSVFLHPVSSYNLSTPFTVHKSLSTKSVKCVIKLFTLFTRTQPVTLDTVTVYSYRRLHYSQTCLPAQEAPTHCLRLLTINHTNTKSVQSFLHPKKRNAGLVGGGGGAGVAAPHLLIIPWHWPYWGKSGKPSG